MDELEIYTSLEDAKEEIWKRWNDKELRRKVEDFLGGDIPESFKRGPRAVLARHITSPNLEYFRFLDLANISGLNPVSLEFLNDKYFSGNLTKLYLGRMPFFQKNDLNITFKDTIDINQNEKCVIGNIHTLWGENFVDFHHRILSNTRSEKIDIFDISDWYKLKGGYARIYIKYYLAIFVCYGILFENYLVTGDECEIEFTKKIVYPAVKKIEEIFGFKPLIVPLIPLNEEAEMFWWCYDKNIERCIE